MARRAFASTPPDPLAGIDKTAVVEYETAGGVVTLSEFTCPVALLRGSPHNAKIHTEDQVAALASSISTFGFRDPVAVDEEGVLLEGHGRMLAARFLGLTEVPALMVTGLSDRQKELYRQAHNALTLDTGNSRPDMARMLAGIVGMPPGVEDRVLVTGSGPLSTAFLGAIDGEVDYLGLDVEYMDFGLGKVFRSAATENEAAFAPTPPPRQPSTTGTQRAASRNAVGSHVFEFRSQEDHEAVRQFLRMLPTHDENGHARTPAQRVLALAQADALPWQVGGDR